MPTRVLFEERPRTIFDMNIICFDFPCCMIGKVQGMHGDPVEVVLYAPRVSIGSQPWI
ncbi:unnamed protein product [Penicillium roqueforti FM164]|uniref:Genomic scaffold, ProqFM164S02 n=1 Tax=Penicillium roqueforti (strain FM164) TaxID=1365484 RepID=W6QK07_PENRF|nr:unnamed protein product [Penicillium roqueforti FM164]